jgi:nucleoside 2-deoxyribosyltransferase
LSQKDIGKSNGKNEAKSIMNILVIFPYPANKKVKEIIQSTLSELNSEVIFVGDRSKEVEEKFSAYILKAIELADVIIADISGFNPNVLYELGYAHGMKKRVLIILSQDAGEIPQAMQGFLYMVYNNQRLDQLKLGIRNWIAQNYSIRALMKKEGEP